MSSAANNSNSTKATATAAAAAIGTAATGAPRTRVPVVLVTGASRGIGLGLAEVYAKAGWRVIATARDLAKADKLQALATAYPATAKAVTGSADATAAAADTVSGVSGVSGVSVVALDVSDSKSTAALPAALAALKPAPVTALDVVINNAGVAGPFTTLSSATQTAEVFASLYRTNVIGVMEVTEAVLPLVRAGAGGVTAAVPVPVPVPVALSVAGPAGTAGTAGTAGAASTAPLALPHVNGPKVVHISSTVGSITDTLDSPFPGLTAAYRASKAGLNSLGATQSREYNAATVAALQAQASASAAGSPSKPTTAAAVSVADDSTIAAAIAATGNTIAPGAIAPLITVMLVQPGWVDTDLGSSGGVKGPVSVAQSAGGIASAIAHTKPNAKATFVDYQNQPIPW